MEWEVIGNRRKPGGISSLKPPKCEMGKGQGKGQGQGVLGGELRMCPRGALPAPPPKRVPRVILFLPTNERILSHYPALKPV